MSKARLIEIVRENLDYAESGTIRQAADIGRVPVEHYFDPERWQRECDQIFKRMPLVLATTSELRQPGDYKALSVMDKPVLICRTAEGESRPSKTVVPTAALRSSQREGAMPNALSVPTMPGAMITRVHSSMCSARTTSARSTGLQWPGRTALPGAGRADLGDARQPFEPVHREFSLQL